jgi:hypothetical protein
MKLSIGLYQNIQSIIDEIGAHLASCSCRRSHEQKPPLLIPIVGELDLDVFQSSSPRLTQVTPTVTCATAGGLLPLCQESRAQQQASSKLTGQAVRIDFPVRISRRLFPGIELPGRLQSSLPLGLLAEPISPAGYVNVSDGPSAMEAPNRPRSACPTLRIDISGTAAIMAYYTHRQYPHERAGPRGRTALLSRGSSLVLTNGKDRRSRIKRDPLASGTFEFQAPEATRLAAGQIHEAE